MEISRRIFDAFEKFKNIYASNGEWDKAYDALVIRRFEECLRLYFFSKKNPKEWKELYKELKQTMCTEPYVTAAKEVEVEKLFSHQQKVAKLMRAGSVAGIVCLYKMKIALKKI